MALIPARATRNLLLALVVVAAFTLGFFLREGGGDPHAHDDEASTTEEAAAPQRWTCSMHPQIILPSNERSRPTRPSDSGSHSQLLCSVTARMACSILLLCV